MKFRITAWLIALSLFAVTPLPAQVVIDPFIMFAGGGESITKNVDANADDGEGLATPLYTSTADPMRCGEPGVIQVDVGFHIDFDSDGPPQGATITSATLNFTTLSSGGTSGIDCDYDIYADDIDDAVALSDTSGNRPEDITKTTATVSGSLAASTSYTIDVTTIMQELVDRGGWTADSAMNWVIFNNPSTVKNHWVDIDTHENGTPGGITVLW